MEKLTRQTQKIFGDNAPSDDIAVLGSFKSGTPIYTDDVATLQNSAFEEGYSASLIADEAPMLEEQNSVPYVLSKQLAYLFQTGIPEWDENTTYYANTGLCQINGILYKSLTDNNIGNNPTTDNENWELLSFGGGSSRNVGETVYSLLPLDDAGLHLLDGTLISGSGAYAAFVAKIAQLYGNGSDVPAYFTTETLWQQSVTTYGVCGKFVYDAAANTVRLPKVTGIVEGTLDANALGDLVEAALPALISTGAHTHTRGTMEITGTIPGKTGFNYTGSFYSLTNSASTFNGSDQNPVAGFAASRSWTGATSSNGQHTHSYNGNVQTSATVQPQTIKGFMYMVVANSAKTEVEVDIDNVMTDLNGKADIDLNNVSSISESSAVGQELASKLNNNQISNCIVEIPNNIKYEITTQGLIILKAGSTVYVSTSGTFEAVTLDTDTSEGGSQLWTNDGSRPCFLVYVPSTNAVLSQASAYTFAQSSAPTTFVGNSALWYDTTNNIMKCTINSGTTWTICSLPMLIGHPGLISTNLNGWSGAIDNVFNGMGFFSTYTFVLPGVKALFANGRNADGTLNNLVGINNAVSFYNATTESSLNAYLGYANSNKLKLYPYGRVNHYEQATPPIVYGTSSADWYNTETNRVYQTGDGGSTWSERSRIFCGSLAKAVNSNFTSCSIKEPLKIFTNYSEPMSRPDWVNTISMGLPSQPTSATTQAFTCPDNGYVLISATRNGSGNTLHVYINGTRRVQVPAYTANADSITLPVARGDVIKVDTDATTATWSISQQNFVPFIGGN